jgi:Sporulation and spore germination
MIRRALPFLAIAAVAALGAYVLFVALPRWYRPQGTSAAAESQPSRPATAERKITATLYFISEDGMSLVGVQREVPFDEPVARQARRIVEAQVGSPPPPFATAVPQETRVRNVFVTEQGCDEGESECKRDAFVDLSPEARTRHTGGALDELFTIYAIVNAVTVNLPAISRVQILVDGSEVDTLAGHVDLRRPLEKNLTWVKTDKDAQ